MSNTDLCGRHTKRCSQPSCRKACSNGGLFRNTHIPVQECSVCLNKLPSSDFVKLKLCKHAFCKDCIDQCVYHEKLSCPLCRAYIVRDHHDFRKIICYWEGACGRLKNMNKFHAYNEIYNLLGSKYGQRYMNEHPKFKNKFFILLEEFQTINLKYFVKYNQGNLLYNWINLYNGIIVNKLFTVNAHFTASWNGNE